MWSSMFDPKRPKVQKAIDWKRLGRLFLPLLEARIGGYRLHYWRIFAWTFAASPDDESD